MEVGYPAMAGPVGIPVEPEVYPPQGPELVELSTPVDEDSWRYSRFALPWLVWCFFWLVALLLLTFWQQTGDLKHTRDGKPRLFELVRDDTSDEASIPKSLRNLRIAGAFFAFFGVVLAWAIFFARPKRGARMGGNMLCALLLIVCTILAWIAFGIGLHHYNDFRACPPSQRWTGEFCARHTAWAVATVTLDAAVAVFAFVAAILLAYNTKQNHFRLAPRDWEEAQNDSLEPPKERVPGEMVQRNVSFVRKWLTGLALVATLILVAAWMVFVVLLHEGRATQHHYGVRGRTDQSRRYDSQDEFEAPGWPAKNTRLRYAACAVGLLAILFNFLPFRSRTIAYCFALLYFCVIVALLVAFGMDVHEVRLANEDTCPNAPDGLVHECNTGSFGATCALDFITFFWLMLYLVIEYIINRSRQCQHCDRAYGMQELIKHETTECTARPVRCAVCAKGMTFKEFGQHAEFCSVDHIRCKNCSTMIPKWGVKTHQDECTRWPVQCTMCEDSFQRHDMPHHVMICPNRPTSCNACGETFRSRDLEAHQALCGEVLVQCDLCNDQMQRFRMQQHQQADCPKRLVECDRCQIMVPRFRFERHQQKECGL
eukprot:NODE_103_length_1940_cov_1596.319937_g66_i6.p1 GENE.NODE_103_length_1940_cov_1596.319937_g66_i6~~NODE_103_length_1940_cov_1596.319937_g66_i6.p1  ORF type:complete len:599 (-),score=239.41 NODE_103_length_1940_cov_1596.319937_g66_i6:67-1863(-)